MKKAAAPPPSPPPILCGECHRAWPAACVCPRPPPDPESLAQRIAAGMVAVALDDADPADVIAAMARDALRPCARCNGRGCRWCRRCSREDIERALERELELRARDRSARVGRSVRAARAELERERGQLGLREVLEHDPRQLPLFDNQQKVRK